MVVASNHLPPEWAFFYSPENLNLEVTEHEYIVKTFKPFYFFKSPPETKKNDARGCDFLLPIGLGNSCAEPRPRALAEGPTGTYICGPAPTQPEEGSEG